MCPPYNEEPPLGNERGVGWIGSYTGGGHTAMGCPALPLGRGRRFAKISVVIFFDAGFGRFSCGLVFGRGRGLGRRWRGGSRWCGGYRTALPQLASAIPDGVVIPLIWDAIPAVS